METETAAAVESTSSTRFNATRASSRSRRRLRHARVIIVELWLDVTARDADHDARDVSGSVEDQWVLRWLARATERSGGEADGGARD